MTQPTPFVGIQMSSRSVFVEGAERVLDLAAGVGGVNSLAWDIFARATTDLARLAGFVDYLKPSLYHLMRCQSLATVKEAVAAWVERASRGGST